MERAKKYRRLISFMLCIIVLLNTVLIDGDFIKAKDNITYQMDSNDQSEQNVISSSGAAIEEDVSEESEETEEIQDEVEMQESEEVTDSQGNGEDENNDETQNSETADIVESAMNLEIGKVNSKQIQLIWNWEEKTTDETYTYECYRNNEKIASQAEEVYIDQEVSGNTIYEYQIKAIDAFGAVVEVSNIVRATTYDDMIISQYRSLEENMEVGDLIINSYELNLNGYNLIVHGDVIINKGALSFYNGYLECDGDFSINDGGYLYMLKTNDYMLVKGNVYWGGNYSRLEAGTLELKGDFYQTVKGNYFQPLTECHVIFSGDALQTIQAVNPFEGITFSTIEITNMSDAGVYSAVPILCDTLIRNGNNIRYGTIPAYSYGYQLEQDTEIQGDFILMEDTLDLNGHTLTIHGNLIQISGKVAINGGKLIVDKDYRMQNFDLLTRQYTRGTGRLIMSNESDVVEVKGDCYFDAYNKNRCTLLNGDLRLTGNVYLGLGFNTDGNHNFILQGTQKQVVTCTGNTISNLINKNISEAGSVVSGQLYIRKNVDDGGRTIGGNLYFMSSTVPANGIVRANIIYRYYTELASEYTIDGDVTINAKCVISSKLTITGSVNVERNGIVTMNNGSLEVMKDLKFDSSEIYMEHDTDYILVHGNWKFASYGKLSAGTLEVKGDFTCNNMTMTDTFRVLLCGTEKQIITAGDKAQFNILELQNTSGEGVYSAKPIKYNKLIRNGTKFLIVEESEGNYGWTLQQDEIINKDLYLSTDTLDLNGHTLTVKGDLIQSGGELSINSGTLIIEGDYRIQTRVEENDTYVYKKSTGYLSMFNAKDTVIIKGNFYSATDIDTRATLTSGTMNIAGNVYICSDATNNQYIFCSTQDHKVVLDGEKSQSIENTYTYNLNTIANLEVTNEPDKTIIINGSIYVTNQLQLNKTVFEGLLKLDAYTALQDNEIFGNVLLNGGENRNFSKDILIHGDLRLNNKLYLEGKIEVLGNVICEKYSGIYLRNGALLVRKSLQGNGTICLTHENDYIYLEGDLNWNGGMELVTGEFEFSGSNFNGGDTCISRDHTVHFKFTGKQKQTINVRQEFRFGILEILNESEEGVWSAKPIQYSELITNGNRFTIGTNEAGEYGRTLEEDETYQGDYPFIEGILDLNGHTLTVEGDFIQSGGVVKVNNGSLLVKGNYIQKAEDNTISTGRLIMEKAEDIVDIDGNLSWNSIKDVGNDFCDGTLRVGGDVSIELTQKFQFTKNHTLVFKGTKNQKLEKSSFIDIANIKIENAQDKSVTFPYYNLVTGTFDDGGKAIVGTVNICNSTRFTNNKTMTNININKPTTTSDNVTFGGNLSLSEDWYVAGEDIHILGELTNGWYASLYMEEGKLTVHGDCKLIGSSWFGDCESFYMTHPKDYILVEGNFSFNNNPAVLTDGILEVKGDYAGYCTASGNHRVILSGSKKQCITAGTFAILELANTSEEGVYTKVQIKYNQIITNGCRFTMAGQEITIGWKLTEDMTIGGDLILGAGTLDLNGHHLTIQGNLKQPAGCVYINGGELTVEGDYLVVGLNEDPTNTSTISYGTIKMTNEKDCITVKGDFISWSRSYNFSDLTAGNMYLEGNFIADDYRNYFWASKSFTVTMSGTKKQILKGGIVLQNLVINNQSNSTVDILCGLCVNGTLTDISKNVGGNYYVNISYFNQVTDGYWSGSLYIVGDNKLEEDFYVEDYFYLGGYENRNAIYNLNGHTITARYITASKSSTYLEGGKIIAHKNMIMNSSLYQKNPSDEIIVGGNLSVGGYIYAEKGKTEVKGDFTVTGTYSSTGEHSTILSGKSITNGRRYVQNVAVNTKTSFNKLILTKNLNSGYYSSSDFSSKAAELVIDIDDQEPPTKVVNLKVTSANSSEIRLAWQAATDNTAVLGYEIYRDGQKIVTTTDPYCKDTRLEPGQTYHYVVYAFDAERNIAEASEEVIAITAQDEQSPEIPGNTTVINRTGSTITVGWTMAIDNVRTVGYEIYRNGEYLTTTTDCFYQDKEVSSNTEYSYTIKAYDNAGNKSELSEAVVSKLENPRIISVFPPQASTISGKNAELNVRFKNIGYSNNNKVSFEYSTDQQEWTRINPIYVGQQAYNVLQYQAQYTWDISKLPSNGEYYVKYTVIDADGNEVSKTVSYYIDKDAPANVNAFAVNSKAGLVYITWLPSNSQHIDYYTIYRKQSDKTKYTEISKITDLEQVMYIDKTAKQGVEYDYYMIATNKYGQESLRSEKNNIMVEPDDLAPYVSAVFPRSGRVSGITTVEITAKDNISVETYLLYGKEENDTEWILVYEGEGKDGTCSIPWDTCNLNGNYQLKTIACDGTGNRSTEVITGTYIVDNEGINKIEGLRANAYDSYIKLEWDDVSEEDFAYFSVEQKTGDTYKEIAQESKNLGYYVKNLQAATEYTFRVVGYDTSGNRGTPSEEIVVTTKADEVQPVIKIVGPTIKQQKEVIPLTMTVADNIGTKEASFYYSYDKNDWKLIKKITSDQLQQSTTYTTDFDISQLAAGTVYVKFEAFDANGNKVSNQPEVIMEYLIDQSAPKQPTGVKATGYDGYIEVTWDEGEDEDIKAYQIYRAVDSDIFELYQENVCTKNFIDTSITSNTAYSYKIQPIDVVGNEGAVSAETVTSSTPDTQKPVIYGIGPKDGTTMNSSKAIKVATMDNTGLQQIIIDFKSQDESDQWKNIVTETLTGKDYLYSKTWDMSGMEDGTYQIRVQVTDQVGNASDYSYVTVTLDNHVEEIENFAVAQGNWELKLDWNACTEDDFSYYEIYKKAEGEESFDLLGSLEENTYTDTDVEPEKLYSYKIRVYDTCGNYMESEELENYALDEDTTPPVAITGEYMQGVVDEVLKFDGTMSTDNVRIMQYQWDMGDGTTLEGPNPIYAYQKAGTYTVTLTVKDAHNNKGQCTIKVEIKEKPKMGQSTIRVTSQSGGPIPYANICIEEEDEVKSFVADYNGEIQVTLEEGTHRIAAYDNGYLPADQLVMIYEKQENEIELQLEKGDIITGELNIHRMTLEEMLVAGIDLSNPDNMETFTFSVSLAFQKKPIPVELEYYVIGDFEYEDNVKVKPINDKVEEIAKKNNMEVTYVSTKENSTGEVKKEDVPILAYIHTLQSVSWLKKMYQVDLGILNNADPQFTITDSRATLELPEGVKLAATKNGQSLVQSMGTIQGKEEKYASWYVMSEDAGNKTLKASFDGILNPFKRAVHAEFEKEYNFEKEGTGLEINVYAEDSAYIGENYYMQFQVTNTSSEPIYGVQTSFPAFQMPKYKVTVEDYVTGEVQTVEQEQVVYSMDYPSSCNSIPVLYGGEEIHVKALLPGESIFGTYCVPFTGTGDADKEYYELAESAVRVLKGSNTEASVNLYTIASHVSKYIVHTVVIDMTWADPIDAATGAFTDTYETMAMTSDSTLSLDLDYNSLAAEEKGEVGYGWSHNYESYIEDNGSSIKVYQSPGQYVLAVPSDAIQRMVNGVIVDGTIQVDDRQGAITYEGISYGTEKCHITKDTNAKYCYVVTFPNGDTSYYDKTGQLRKMKTENGKEIDLEYSTNKTVITNPISNQNLILNYSEEGQLISVADGTGRKTTLSYKDGCLQSVTNPLGEKTTYEYDKDKQLKTSYNADGIVRYTNYYDAKGRVVKQEDADPDTPDVTMTYEEKGNITETVLTNRNGESFTLTTDKHGNVLKVVEPEGGTQIYNYENGNQLTWEKMLSDATMYYEYDQNGNRDKIIDCYKNETKMTYDEKGNVTTVTDPYGVVTSYEYDEHNQLVKETKASGLTKRYEYNENGQLILEYEDEECIKSYAYKDGLLVSLVDKRGETDYTINYTYDVYGNVIETTTSDGLTQKFSYDKLNRLIKQIDELGNEIAYTYDCDGNRKTVTANGIKTTYTYENGNLVKETKTDGQGTTYESTFTCDNEGSVTKVENWDGSTTTSKYDKNGNVVQTIHNDELVYNYVYDQANRLVKMEEPGGLVTKKEYYPNDRIKKVTNPDGTWISYVYDKNWRLASTLDNKGGITSYEYDESGNVTASTNELGDTIHFTYDKYGNMITTTDAMGNVTKYAYNRKGECIKKTNALDEVTEFAYDNRGNLIRIVIKAKTGDICESYEYDALNRIVCVTKADGTKTRTNYDEHGNCKSVQTSGSNEQTGEEESQTVEYEYDVWNQLQSETSPDGVQTIYEYVEGQNSISKMIEYANTNAEKITSYSYDELKRLTESTDALNGVSQCTYDETGNVASITNPLDGGLTYEYDEAGRVTSRSNTKKQTSQYSYNADGLLEESKDANENTTTYEYDALGRICKKVDVLGNITYKYDKNSNVIEVKDENGTIKRTYDALNRVKTYTDYKGQTVEYSYDELGNLISLTYPGGEIVRYTYYDNGNLETVVDWDERVTKYSYTSISQISRMDRPDGTAVLYEYDSAGRKTSMKDIRIDTDEVISEELYQYDEAGQITTITKNANDGATADRAKDVKPVTMTYDKENRLLTYNGEKVEYDNNGNMVYGPLDGEMVQYVYDCRNRLIQAGDVSYEYDAENQRIAVIEAGIRTDYVINSNTTYSQVLTVTESKIDNTADVEGEQAETTIENGATSYVYGVGLLSQQSEDSGYLTYHFNNIGSTTAITDQHGEVVQNYKYGPYGELLEANEEEDTLSIRFLYVGEYGVITDENSLCYMRERYYNVDSRRFISEDYVIGDIRDSASLNRYAYVVGNPLIYIDPFGTNPKSLLTTLGHSILNVVGFIPGVGDMADLINAAWYAAEGNTKEALTCLISAVPFVGSTIGNTIRIASKGAKWALKAAKYVEAISNIAAGAATLYRTAGSATERAINLFDKYVVKKEKFDGKGAMEVMGLVVDTVGCVLSGKQMKNGIGALSKQMRLDKQIKFAMDGYSLADADPYDMMSKRGMPSVGDSKGGDPSENYVYRALNQKDYERLSNGLGLEARNPDGTWTLQQHIVNGSGTNPKAWANDPFISTTLDINVAKGFNEAGNGLGIAKIDLSKVSNESFKGFEIFPRVNGQEGLAYHYSVWQQEVSVKNSIPLEAIVGYIK
ncbi:fibronectin type III domain-containing protein [Anaerosporobacter faecicola]|uniref:fibronectin type III domain-containing protein n=1 Tax=Anaerosporobacter faecicola TaxID=2718714 RepID=UPI00143CA542|nr:PKD domain-containing protein [Anaerosporobacter faecicola]